MSIPYDPYPFGNKYSTTNAYDFDGVVFDFVNAGSDPRLQVVYQKGCGEDEKYAINQLNLGAVNPVAGIPADKNPVNVTLAKKIGSSCVVPNYEITARNSKIGSMYTNNIGVLKETLTNTFTENKLIEMIPEAFSNTTSNYIKERSDAYVYGDTTLPSTFTSTKLKDVAEYWKNNRQETKSNSLERKGKIKKEKPLEKKIEEFLDKNLNPETNFS